MTVLLGEALTSAIVVLFAVLLWNNPQQLFHSDSPDLLSPASSKLPLLGPHSSAQIFFLSGTTDVDRGFHICVKASFRVLQKSRIDWGKCGIVLRWLLPADVIVNVNELNRFGMVQSRDVRAVAQWSTLQPVDLELPRFFLPKAPPTVLSARINFDLDLGAAHKWDFSVTIPDIQLRYQRADPSGYSPAITIPAPSVDFACAEGDQEVDTGGIFVDIISRAVHRMQATVRVPVVLDEPAWYKHAVMTATIAVGMWEALALLYVCFRRTK